MLEVAIRRLARQGADGAPREILRDLTLSVAKGEFVCLFGPSGCGKTTTLRALLGLETGFDGATAPTPGAVRIGAAFQEPRLLPWRTVEENVRLALGPDAASAAALDLGPLFASLGLAGREGAYPQELSGGQARRAALARAFAGAPEALLLDEPFVSLDAETAKRLRALLMALWRARPAPALMVTHDIDEALELADRILVMGPSPGPLRGEFSPPAPRETRDEAARREMAAAFFAAFPVG